MKTVERLASLMQHLHLDAACFATQILGDIADLAAQFRAGHRTCALATYRPQSPYDLVFHCGRPFLRSNVGWADDARKLEGAKMAVPHAPDSLLHPTSCWTNAAGIVTMHHAVFDEKLDDDIRDRLRMRHSCHDMGAAAVCGHQSAKGTHPQRSP